MEKLMWEKVFGKATPAAICKQQRLNLRTVGQTSSPKAWWGVIPACLHLEREKRFLEGGQNQEIWHEPPPYD